MIPKEEPEQAIVYCRVPSMLGKHHTTETKKKISVAKKGHFHTIETKNKIVTFES